jgi:hypothetical protein
LVILRNSDRSRKANTDEPNRCLAIAIGFLLFSVLQKS